ncbi:MAG: DUF45 domain-containing protein [Bacteroidales bacterium]|nr:DUF45 domain-containing protein [Bacteroidales bacterium]
MAVKGEKKYHDPEIGEVTFRKNTGSSRMSIKVHPLKGVSVTVPYVVPYAAAMLFFQARRDWVLETMARQKERYKDVHIPSEEEIESLRRQARKELPPRLAVLAERYGFRYNRVTIKHNATNWGSCSAKGNINLNLNIIRLPAVFQDYVLLHELCHLRHQDHGHAFHLLLEHVLTDNILKLIDAGDETALGLARKAAASKAKYPLDYTCTRAIKHYPLV